MVSFENCLYFCYDKLFTELESILKEFDSNSHEKITSVNFFFFNTIALIMLLVDLCSFLTW